MFKCKQQTVCTAYTNVRALKAILSHGNCVKSLVFEQSKISDKNLCVSILRVPFGIPCSERSLAPMCVTRVYTAHSYH